MLHKKNICSWTGVCALSRVTSSLGLLVQDFDQKNIYCKDNIIQVLETVAVSQCRGSILRNAYLKCNYVTTSCEACPNSKCPPNAPHKCLLLLPVSGGHTTTILHGYKLPKIQCMPKEKKLINKKWQPQVEQISHLNVSIGFVLGFYSFERQTPDMLNLKGP